LSPSHHQFESPAPADQTKINEGNLRAKQGYKAFENGDFGEAVQQLEAAIEKDGITIYPLEEVFTMLGNSYEKRDCLDEALAAHIRALEINPNDHRIWVNAGIVYRRMGNYVESETCYVKALTIEPEYAEAHGSLGALNTFRGEPIKAIEALEKALVINPQLAMAHGNMALALAMAGRFEAADASLRRAVILGYPTGKVVRERIDSLKAISQASEQPQ
jgi:tetratricopeptide (TPR) repeat protein